MKFEKLNNDKIRITLNVKDLQEKEIDYQSFMSNSNDTQQLFLDMLEEAEKEIGFITKDYKIMIEALATIDGDFILTVTRSLPEEEFLKKKNVKIKRKTNAFDKENAIYCFQTFDDFCNFCQYIQQINFSNLDKFSKDLSLYSYLGKYYLIINNINLEFENIKSFYYIISEFGQFINNSDLFSKKLSEYGKVIIKKNALKTAVKYFS